MRNRLANVLVGLALIGVAAAPATARNGMLGVFFDEYGGQCSSTLRQGGITQMYVVFMPEGDTRGGITGAEFRIDMQDADGYHVLGSENLLPIGLGDPFGGRMTVATGDCLSNLAIPLVRFQVQNISGGSNAKFVAKVGDPPSAPTEFPCALIVLCDAPAFTKICVETGKAVLNASGSTLCGSNSESAEWSRIKELYR